MLVPRTNRDCLVAHIPALFSMFAFGKRHLHRHGVQSSDMNTSEAATQSVIKHLSVDNLSVDNGTALKGLELVHVTKGMLISDHLNQNTHRQNICITTP